MLPPENTQHTKTPNFFRRRTGWNGFLPHRDQSGLWLQVQWLIWTWDYFPEPVSASVGRMVDSMRSGLL